METRKLVLPLFLGGSICCLIALVFAPAFWWLGLFAGFAVGYVSYEFREMIRAFPSALRTAERETAYGCRAMAQGFVRWIKQWGKTPHPFFFSAIVVMAPVYWVVVESIIVDTQTFYTANPDVSNVLSIVFCVIATTICFVLFLFVMLAVAYVVYVGARYREDSYCEELIWLLAFDGLWAFRQRMRDNHVRQKPLTYLNFFRWFGKGVMQILLFIFWIIWKKLAIFAWRTLRLFVWVFAELIKLIHSNDRVILGFHGMLGGAIGYLSFGSAAEQLSEQILLVIASGVLSIALGLIGKRFLSEKSQTANGV